MRIQHREDAHGLRAGDAIPGSRWFRGFCHHCREPIRVQCKQTAITGLCECCDCQKHDRVAFAAIAGGRTPLPGTNITRNTL